MRPNRYSASIGVNSQPAGLRQHFRARRRGRRSTPRRMRRQAATRHDRLGNERASLIRPRAFCRLGRKCAWIGFSRRDAFALNRTGVAVALDIGLFRLPNSLGTDDSDRQDKCAKTAQSTALEHPSHNLYRLQGLVLHCRTKCRQPARPAGISLPNRYQTARWPQSIQPGSHTADVPMPNLPAKRHYFRKASTGSKYAARMAG